MAERNEQNESPIRISDLIMRGLIEKAYLPAIKADRLGTRKLSDRDKLEMAEVMLAYTESVKSRMMKGE